MDLMNQLMARNLAGASGGGGSSVIANPTLEGTESALSGLEVDGTKYKVESGGGHLYLHIWRASSMAYLQSFVISDSPTPFTTVASVADWYESVNGRNNISIPVIGGTVSGGPNNKTIISDAQLRFGSTVNINVSSFDASNATTVYSTVKVADTVIQIL